MVCKKPKNKKITLLQIILDQCWICPDKPNLYYVKLGDQPLIYCPNCEYFSSISNIETINRIKNDFDYIFLTKEAYNKKYGYD